jgi:hypothetical protein
MMRPPGIICDGNNEVMQHAFLHGIPMTITPRVGLSGQSRTPRDELNLATTAYLRLANSMSRSLPFTLQRLYGLLGR